MPPRCGDGEGRGSQGSIGESVVLQGGFFHGHVMEFQPAALAHRFLCAVRKNNTARFSRTAQMCNHAGCTPLGVGIGSVLYHVPVVKTESTPQGIIPKGVGFIPPAIGFLGFVFFLSL